MYNGYHYGYAPAPGFVAQPNWTGQDWFQAHYGALGPTRSSYRGTFPHTVLGEIFAAIKNLFRFGVGAGLDEARRAHARVYGHFHDLRDIGPKELGAAAGYQAFLIWENHHTALISQTTYHMHDVGEWVAGMAIAEVLNLCERSGQYGEAPKDACEWAAETAEKCYEETHSRLRRLRRSTLGPGLYPDLLQDEVEGRAHGSWGRRRTSSYGEYGPYGGPGGGYGGYPAGVSGWGSGGRYY